MPAELIVRYVDGTLDGDERATVEKHTDTCASCRMALSELAAGSLAKRSTIEATGGDSEEPQIAVGAAIGRYIVLYRIGRGGMATVYAAFDPELDRKIALKVLRGRRDHARLLREARTLAALTHPHVVGVFDVGEHDGVLFIAMEYVEGQTVRAWLASKPTWAELQPVFLGAARALSAAHAKGIIHRDVKPENLLLDREGVVRVGDFGLAVAGGAVEDAAGTPAYMAPEQRAGEASAQSDQYSFCMTLFEAIYGVRPDGEKHAPIADAPRAVLDAVRRGLAERPMDRHLSMRDLETVLAPRRASRGWWLLGAAALAGVGATAIIATRTTTPGEQCDVAAATDGARWAAARDGVKAAFETAHPKAGASVFRIVDREVAKYYDAWGAMSTESCTRTHVRGEQSSALLDLRTRCLDQRLAAVLALTDVFAKADAPAVVEGAPAAIAGLPPITGCADVDALTALVPRPTDPGVAKHVDALDARLTKAAALQLTGQYPAAAVVLTPVLAEATKLDYAPLLAKARFLDGDLQYRNGEYAKAVTALEQAVADAARGRDDRTATKAMTLLAGLIGYVQGKPDQGMALASAADAWLTRAGRTPEDEAELADIRGLLHDAKGEALLAKPFYETALSLRTKLYGKDHLLVALSLNNLAAVPHQLGKIDEARELHRRALEIRERALGPVAADVAVSLNAIASLDEAEGKHADAKRGFERAIEIWTTVLGKDHPDVAAAHNNLGNLLREMGDHAGALRELDRALAIWPPEHPSAISALGNVAITYYDQKDYARALSTFDAVIERTKKVLGENHPGLASDFVNRGQTYVELGRHADAAKDFATAVAMFEATVPAGDRRIAWALTMQGKHELSQKRPATRILERALAILEADQEARPTELGAARFALARAKWEAGARAEAVKLARAARDGTKDVAVIDAWLQGKP